MTADPACICEPCPGRGNDGHRMTHCAECCFGTGVEVDLDCPVHGQPPVTADHTPEQLSAEEAEARTAVVALTGCSPTLAKAVAHLADVEARLAIAAAEVLARAGKVAYVWPVEVE